MESEPRISFEDTANAFSYKSDKELKKAHFIFSTVNHPWISAMVQGSVKLALNLRLPIEGIIRKTVFDHFVGGISIEDSEDVIQKLGHFGVGTILDYSVEGEDSEASFDATTKEIVKTIEKAGKSKFIPFSVFKVTGLGSTELLEKIQIGSKLSNEEIAAFQRVRARVDKLCSAAYQYKVPILVDAEETWIQEPIDMLAEEMMALYNKEEAIVFNTYQLYRTASLSNLKKAYEKAVQNNYYLGAKIVRGAYMEKERARAAEIGYPSPIQETKVASDKAFNEALLFCVDHIDKIAFMCGSHNEYSNLYLTKLMAERKIKRDDKRVWFAQLFGMSDNISFNLAKEGYKVAKYVPYGPVRSVMPYLFRRAAENTSVAGQSSRELTMIRKELARRKKK
ncbi:MAG TPA: proline dehydrogenase family protein [Chryseosolibacter sp.]